MPVNRHLSAAAVSAFMICIVAIYGTTVTPSSTDVARAYKATVALDR